jgi:hypothetical protein
MQHGLVLVAPCAIGTAHTDIEQVRALGRCCHAGQSGFDRVVPIAVEGKQRNAVALSGVAIEEELTLLDPDVACGYRCVHLHHLREESTPSVVQPLVSARIADELPA